MGLSPKELESLNELIRFDHEYHKAPSSVVQKTSSSQVKNTQPVTIPELSVEDVSLLDNILSNDKTLEGLLDELSQTPVQGQNNSQSHVQKVVSVRNHNVSPVMDKSRLSVPNSPRDYYSDSGYSDVASPSSICSSGLSDDVWEESFTELFPGLI